MAKKSLKGADVEGARGLRFKQVKMQEHKLPDHLTHDLGSGYGHKRLDPTTVIILTRGVQLLKVAESGAKGGGIAKRGTGAAFKSGGRVKSMGIAKRGGGVSEKIMRQRWWY